jgi:hypothetical protein
MRKSIALTWVALLALTMALAAVGCGGQKTEESTSETTTETTMPPDTLMPDTSIVDTMPH